MARWEKKPETPQEPASSTPQAEEKPVSNPYPQPEPPVSTPLVLTSSIDAYIHEKLKEQPRTLEEIEVREQKTPEGKHALALPDEIEKKYAGRFGFRWINKDKRMVDRATTIRGWVVVNRTYFPDLSRSLFTAIGTIERGDSILGFMPLKQAEHLRAEPGRLSQERVRNLPIDKWKEGGSAYYKPKLSETEEIAEETHVNNE